MAKGKGVRPEVFFLDYRSNVDVVGGVKKLFKRAGLSEVVRGRVAVKLHIGEWGNITYLRPPLVKAVVDAVKEAGGEPFLTDTTTLYPKQRFTVEGCRLTAAIHGFTEALGASFMVADAPDGFAGVEVEAPRLLDGCRLRGLPLASAIAQADSLILVVHAKGHLMTGFGGALKHAAMGCVTKAGKAAQHAAMDLLYEPSKCDGCGACVEACPFHALRLEGGLVVRDGARCMHCNACLFTCSKGAWSWSEEGKARFQLYLAHAAAAVLSWFSGRLGVVSFVQDVTPLCDCATPAGVPLIPDVGVLASLDPVAVDAASLHLIDVAAERSWHEARPPNFLAKVTGVDPWAHVKLAERLGVGSTSYRLVEL